MRKMKKINGYLVVRFNDRERRDYETLGAYGAIDAELYTGHLEVDRGALEYDDAETMEQAIEQARGLESELDVEEPEAAVTVIVETELGTTELETTPEELLQGEKRYLPRQYHFPHGVFRGCVPAAPDVLFSRCILGEHAQCTSLDPADIALPEQIPPLVDYH